MHALESESILIILQCPGWIVSESVRIPVDENRYTDLSDGEVHILVVQNDVLDKILSSLPYLY